MATHYPHVGADENKPGLHYSGNSAVIHKRGSDLQRKNFSGSAKSAANPRSWASPAYLTVFRRERFETPVWRGARSGGR